MTFSIEVQHYQGAMREEGRGRGAGRNYLTTGYIVMGNTLIFRPGEGGRYSVYGVSE
jgi:hypothetical protein